ncbi:hypothetical protein B0T18DRAFT_208058 [Schizothecium vesticola]|uniref:CCHC-type domain-containing protein n=1 Tax=Schizothecium vesticola TaxID=314040 RepID=A0AA40JYU4_9PEZI|nr:hypothetical protein B0T18DRAFT_208058 [Schizothecium vesticola]
MSIKTRTFGRSAFTGKEKRVDTSLVGDLSMSVGHNMGRGVKDGVHYVVVSGDWDVAGSAMDSLKDSGFPLHIWAWDRAMVAGLRSVTPGKDLVVHYLNDILDRITLTSTPPSMHPRSLVILNPAADAKNKPRIYDFFLGSSVQWKQDEIDGHLIIIPVHDDTEDDKKQQVVLDRCLREVKESWTLEKLGCQVKTLEEYRAGHSPVKDDSGGKEHHRNDSWFSRTKNESSINNNNTLRSFGQTTSFRPQDWCKFGRDCGKGLQCTYRHTQDEKEHFETRKDRRRKTALCRYGQDCRWKREYCRFAHGVADLSCEKCHGRGHEKRDCPGNFKTDHILNNTWRKTTGSTFNSQL